MPNRLATESHRAEGGRPSRKRHIFRSERASRILVGRGPGANFWDFVRSAARELSYEIRRESLRTSMQNTRKGQTNEHENPRWREES